MSGDISPSDGSWLDAPARPGGERDQGAAVRRPDRGEPSIVRVVATTLRLWWRRRVLRLDDGDPVGAVRWSVLAAVMVIVFAAGGVAIAAGGSAPAPAPRKPVPRPPSAAQLLTDSNEQSASAWVQAQVDSGALLGCDPAMCGYLQDAGIPAANDVMFTRGAAVPGSAAFVLSTPLLRAQSGSSLAAGAPEVAARFGTGQERVDVLVTSSGSAATFLQAVSEAQHASARLGKSLARNKRLHAGATARHAMTTGMVDHRLLVVLKRMLAAHPVSVASFGDASLDASWHAQLRSMTVGGLVHHVGRRRVSYVHAELSLVRGLKPPYTAAVRQVTRAHGGTALVIQVPLRNSF